MHDVCHERIEELEAEVAKLTNDREALLEFVQHCMSHLSLPKERSLAKWYFENFGGEVASGLPPSV